MSGKILNPLKEFDHKDLISLAGSKKKAIELIVDCFKDKIWRYPAYQVGHYVPVEGLADDRLIPFLESDIEDLEAELRKELSETKPDVFNIHVPVGIIL